MIINMSENLSEILTDKKTDETPTEDILLEWWETSPFTKVEYVYS